MIATFVSRALDTGRWPLGSLAGAEIGAGQLQNSAMESELVDRIYECGFAPELWPQVLRDTSKISESAGASLYVTNPEVTAWTASKNTRDIAERFVADGWYWRGQLMSRIHNARHPGFLREVDLFSPGELDAEPIFRDNWRKMGDRKSTRLNSSHI